MNARELAIKALKSNNLAFFKTEHLDVLANPAVDITFESLDMDSLGRMELSIWLELELGLEVTEVEVQDMASINGLAQFIDKHYINYTP